MSASVSTTSGVFSSRLSLISQPSSHQSMFLPSGSLINTTGSAQPISTRHRRLHPPASSPVVGISRGPPPEAPGRQPLCRLAPHNPLLLQRTEDVQPVRTPYSTSEFPLLSLSHPQNFPSPNQGRLDLSSTSLHFGLLSTDLSSPSFIIATASRRPAARRLTVRPRHLDTT